MKRKIIEKEYTLPVWCLSYLVNGDASGITEEEKEAFDNWLKAENLAGFSESVVDGSERFSWRNDIDDLGSDVVDVVFWKSEN